MVNELEIWLENQCRRERIHQTTDKVENKTRDLRMTTTIDGKLKQLKRPVVRLEPMFYENVSREKKQGRQCWRHSSASKETQFGTCWLRNKTYTLKNVDEKLKKVDHQFWGKPPICVFSKILSQRAMKLGTHWQVHNTNTPD